MNKVEQFKLELRPRIEKEIVDNVGNNEWLKETLDNLNNLIFDNTIKLPQQIEWSKRMTRAAGKVTYKRVGENQKTKSAIYKCKNIRFSVSIAKLNPKEFIDTLIHEMIHVQQINKTEKDNVKVAHNKYFLDVAEKINLSYKTNVKVYHNMKTYHRYTITCQECGYEYHKNKDVTTGYTCKCGGKLKITNDKGKF